MKRIFCLYLTAMLLCGCMVGGAAGQSGGAPTVDIVRRQVTVSGTAQPGDWLTLFVSVKETGSAKGDVLVVAETGAASAGEFSFVFDMPDVLRSGESAEREYYYRIGSMNDGLLWTGTFRYELPLSLADALAALAQCQTAQQADELLLQKKYLDLFASLGILTTEYQAMQPVGRQAVCKWLMEQPPSESGFADAAPLWNQQILLQRLAETDADGAAKLLEAHDYQIVFSDGKTYSQATAGEKQAVSAALAGKVFADFTASCRAADLAYGLCQVENTAYQSLHTVMTVYAKTFGITDADVAYLNGLSANKRSEVYRIWKQLLTGQENLTAQAVADACKTAIARAGKDTGGTGGGGGTGGSKGSGGGRTSGGSSAVSLPATAPEQQTEYQKDETPHNFDDMAQAAWAAEAVTALSNKGILRGTAMRTFEPNRNITRAECLKIVLTAFELASHEYTGEQPFEDVALDSWYYYYVTSGVKLGIVNGTGGGAFEPDREITREEMASMFYRASKKGYVGYQAADLEKECFTDQTDISAYALEAVLTLQQHGVLSGMGDGRFAPQSTATRAETAQMVYNLLHSLELV